VKQAVWKKEKRWVSIAESTVFGIPYSKLEGIGLGLGLIGFIPRKDPEAHRRGLKTVFDVMALFPLCRVGHRRGTKGQGAWTVLAWR
jgi:hypothetical protein